MKRLFLALGTLVLVLSLGLAIFDANRELPPPTLQQPLKELLPTGEEFGWTSEDLPLGPTEALEEASQRLLNLTDFVYRRYTRGNDSFEVYIGYWAPGTMPARDMNTHTPDTCWVGAGWEITERDTRSIPISETQATLDGRWRWFEKDNSKINVIFWHVLDNATYQYGNQSFGKRLTALVTDPFKYGLNMRKEQFLIRISSTDSLDDIWAQPIAKGIVADLSIAQGA